MVGFIQYISALCGYSKQTVKCCFIALFALFVLTLLSIIISSVLLSISVLSLESSKIYIGDIQNGDSFNLNFDIAICPKVNLLSSGDAFYYLQLNLRTDAQATESLLLHYYAGENDHGYTNLISTCVSAPGISCSLTFPLYYSHFIAVVSPTTQIDEYNSTQFIWYCDYWMNPVKTGSLSSLVISLFLLIILIIFFHNCCAFWFVKTLQDRNQDLQSQLMSLPPLAPEDRVPTSDPITPQTIRYV